MKKLLAALISVILAISLSACCCVSLLELNDKNSNYSFLSVNSNYDFDEKIGKMSLNQQDVENVIRKKTDNPIICFESCDFDLNNTKEAFVVTGVPADDELFKGMFISCDVWYVDSLLNVTLVAKENGLIPHPLIKAENYGFLKYEISGGGSGNLSYIYGVRDNVPYELMISGKYMGFTDDDNKYTALTHDFSNGHNYITNYFFFDSKMREFYIEGVIFLEQYLIDNKLSINGKKLSDKFPNMTYTREIWNIYNGEEIFIESNDNDEIFRMEWSEKRIVLYGLTIGVLGSPYKQCKENLGKNGYALVEKDSRINAKKFTNGYIDIWIYFGNVTQESDNMTATYFSIRFIELEESLYS